MTTTTEEPTAEVADPRDVWLDSAREFVLSVDGHTVVITRYNNHRRLIEDGGWVAMFPLGALNPWYAVMLDGTWQARYKFFTPLATREDAWRAAVLACRFMVAEGKWQDRT